MYKVALLFGIVGSVALSSSAIADDTPGCLANEYRDASAWFQTLAFPETVGKPFVRITVERRERNGALQTIHTYGFVLSQYQYSHSVLTTDLRRLDISVLPDKDLIAAAPRVRLEAANFSEYAQRVLDDVGSYDRESVQGFCWELGPGAEAGLIRPLTLSHSAKDFVLSQACRKNGMHELADRLARRAADTKTNNLAPPNPLETELRLELCGVFVGRAMASFANPAINRQDILAQLQWVSATLRPENPWREWLELDERILVLRRMVREDHDQKPPDRRRLEKLPPDALVYFLRDQGELSLDVYPGFRSPTQQLVDLGPGAVAALIDAIGDDRYTREVCPTDTFSQVDCTRVGEMSLLLLRAIAGEPLPVNFVSGAKSPDAVAKNKERLRDFFAARP